VWARLDAVAGLLHRSHAQGRSDAFFALLEPVLRSLADHLRHGLETLENEDGLPGEDVTLDDVLDEALARAWDRFGENAEHADAADRPLGHWLQEVVADALRQSNHRLAQRSLEEEFAEPVDDADDPLREAWAEPGGYPTTVELAESIAGHPGVDAWDRLSDEAQRSGLSEPLGKLPRDQRQALLLSLMEGFSPAEIADFQGRPASEVQADIDLAQQTLRRELDAAALDALEARLTAARHRTRGRP
jgi:DNA-directed RNA polymerase specialized sigma24 family protein